MNKYTELSDFKINRRIAVMIHKYSDFIEQYDNKTIYVDGNVFDPCNNPADAMPIIIENDIAIFPAHKLGIENWCAASGFYDIGEREVIWGMESNNKNPLRAAMELFLLMRDAENNNVN
ncbi:MULTISPECIES: phage protein NinX family protein [Providencia]|uniref:phage protein NinX family protein n=1 Tax=Providencia TaxID=586 RepID=UPI00197F9145|nr:MULTISPECIES: phage protein NinX family protein [Providencia]MBN4863316.1 DUF2591 family protein [Providencia stuartii]MBN4876425.1 DUF2591 family protein [Providencia stuartii]MBN4878241.1 DUF2591 family protein [Providencia stuartii]MBN4881839.1 DUF2591 family protein [Providencia stuartii]